jgi:hypothetical protein
MLARQALYHLSHSTSLNSIILIFIRERQKSFEVEEEEIVSVE